MSENSVNEWLKTVRYQFENYDDHNNSIILRNDILLNNMETNKNKYDFELIDKVNYGRVCRVSFQFSDQIQHFRTLPRVFQTLDLDLSADVMMWKNQLRYKYYGEEENQLETEELLKEIDDNNGLMTTPSGSSSSMQETLIHSVNRTPRFPIEEPHSAVQIRRSSNNFRQSRDLAHRPKTFDSSIQRSSIAEDLVKIREEYKVKGLLELKIPLLAKSIELSVDENLYIGDNVLTVKGTDKNNVIFAHRFKLQDIVIINSANNSIKEKKTSVALKDNSVEGLVYEFKFKSSKDVKTFSDWIKNRKIVQLQSTTNHYRPQQHQQQNQNQSKIKKTISKLLRKRASRDMLEVKGIIKNETIFGNTIQDLCSMNKNDIPEFLKRIIKLIELPDNITQLGIYRASGNMAIIQKIRLHIDDGKLSILDEYKKDVDLLTGTLKLFFRELKDSLITFSVFENILKAIEDNSNLLGVKRQIDTLPNANYRVLSFLLDHLVKVCHYHNLNKMDFHNMAIAWGPSLISFDNIASNLNSIAFHSANSHKVTEFLLNNYGNMFEPIREEDRLFKIVETLIKLIERDIVCDGIYRRNGAVNSIEIIMKQLSEYKLDNLERFTVHDLCSSLKKHIRNGPVALFSENIIQKYTEIITNSSEIDKCELQKMLIDTMKNSEANFKTINLLLQHWHKVIAINDLNVNSLIDTWTMVLISEEDRYFKEKMTRFSEFLRLLLVKHCSVENLNNNERIFSTYENVEFDANFLGKTDDDASTKL